MVCTGACEVVHIPCCERLLSRHEMYVMPFDSDVDLPVYREDHTGLQKTEGRNIMTKSMKSQACAIAMLLP